MASVPNSSLFFWQMQWITQPCLFPWHCHSYKDGTWHQKVWEDALKVLISDLAFLHQDSARAAQTLWVSLEMTLTTLSTHPSPQHRWHVRVRVWTCPQYWNRRPRRPWSEDRGHLGGPKHLIAEEAEGTKQHGGQAKVKEQQEDKKLNSSWKLSVIKVLCEDLQFWLCGRKAYLPPKTTSYCWDAKINAREYMLAAFSSPLYWKEQQ